MVTNHLLTGMILQVLEDETSFWGKMLIFRGELSVSGRVQGGPLPGIIGVITPYIYGLINDFAFGQKTLLLGVISSRL